MLILLNKNNIILFLSIILLLMILFTNLGFYTYCKKNARKGYIIERQCFFYEYSNSSTFIFDYHR